MQANNNSVINATEQENIFHPSVPRVRGAGSGVKRSNFFKLQLVSNLSILKQKFTYILINERGDLRWRATDQRSSSYNYDNQQLCLDNYNIKQLTYM
jgi:hypothetical protein